VQEVLIGLFQLVQAGKVREKGGFRKLVSTFARYRCVDAYYADRRRRERETAAIDPDQQASSGAGPDAALDQEDRSRALVYIVQRLPEACRSLWRLVYSEQLPAEEVARKIGITVNNVRVRVHRCLKKARELHERWQQLQPGEAGDEH